MFGKRKKKRELIEAVEFAQLLADDLEAGDEPLRARAADSLSQALIDAPEDPSDLDYCQRLKQGRALLEKLGGPPVDPAVQSLRPCLQCVGSEFLMAKDCCIEIKVGGGFAKTVHQSNDMRIVVCRSCGSMCFFADNPASWERLDWFNPVSVQPGDKNSPYR